MEALSIVDKLMPEIQEKYAVVEGTVLTPRGEDMPQRDDSVEYMYFKLMYTKAKLMRKMRKL